MIELIARQVPLREHCFKLMSRQLSSRDGFLSSALASSSSASGRRLCSHRANHSDKTCPSSVLLRFGRVAFMIYRIRPDNSCSVGKLFFRDNISLRIHRPTNYLLGTDGELHTMISERYCSVSKIVESFVTRISITFRGVWLRVNEFRVSGL